LNVSNEQEEEKMNKIDVLVIGRSCLDYIAVVNQFPAENQKLPLEFRLTEGGGQGGTSSCCISRLGGKVAYVGKLGDDDEGRFCLKRLEDFGVKTEFVEIVNGGKTPVAYVFITTDSGARSIIYERNALPKIKIDATLKNLVMQSGIALLDPEGTYLGRQ
jgi:sugar/nucleoside kinase (ribokinase family)